jgi:hypothetical protein
VLKDEAPLLTCSVPSMRNEPVAVENLENIKYPDLTIKHLEAPLTKLEPDLMKQTMKQLDF